MNKDYALALMTGADIPIVECQITLHQPTIYEISQLGEKKFFQGVSYLCVDKTSLKYTEVDVSSLSNFELLMETVKQKPEIKEYLQQVLMIFFPKHKIILTPRSYIFSQEGGENIIIDNENFDSLQQVIRHVLCIQHSDAADFKPANAQAEEIAKKLLKARQRVAALKKQEEESEGSSLAQFLSILTIGQGSVSLREAIHYTLYQVYDLLQRHNLYISWDIDLRSRLAGGKPEKQPDNWMKKIH